MHEAIVTKQMKPFSTVITHINVVVSDVLCMATKQSKRFVVVTNVIGLAIALCWVSEAYATAIVGLLSRCQDKILLGADSRVTYEGGTPEQACKIFIVRITCSL